MKTLIGLTMVLGCATAGPPVEDARLTAVDDQCFVTIKDKASTPEDRSQCYAWLRSRSQEHMAKANLQLAEKAQRDAVLLDIARSAPSAPAPRTPVRTDCHELGYGVTCTTQ